MNRRIDSSDNNAPVVATIAGIVVLATILALVYVFVIRDDKDDKGSTSSNQVRTEQTFTADRVPFTFQYPGNFAPAPTPEGFIWIAGIGKFDVIDVKRLANKERSIAETRTEIRQTLEARPGLTIRGDGTETLDDLKAVRFTVDSAVDGQALRSTLYYFSIGGASFQVECQSTVAGRDEIDAACAKMVNTFSAN